MKLILKLIKRKDFLLLVCKLFELKD